MLLEHGADKEIKAKDQSGGTPLQWAAFFVIKHVTEFMVNAGSDINAKSSYGYTPLCAASVPNQCAGKTDETFKENRAYIRKFLESNGGKID